MSDEKDSAYQPDEPPDIAVGADKAFAQADNHELFGQELFPFTGERMVAAQAMGMLWPSVSAEGYREFGLYKGELNDAIVCLWLCTVPSQVGAIDPNRPSSSWSVKRAMRTPDSAATEALRWAEEKGISKPNSEPFWKAIKAYEAIIVEINESVAVAKP